MTDLLSVGASGLRAYQGALAVTGDNIANAQTPGYARRAVRLAEPTPGGNNIIYRPQVGADGVQVTGVTRAIDRFLTEDARAAGGDAARSATRLAWLEATERALDDGGDGVGRSLTGVFNRADELAADPGNSTRRTAFLQSANDLATSFRRTAASLSSAASGVGGAASLAVEAVNNDVAALASVNDGLRRARDGSANQASLMDARDQLLDRLSSALPLTITYEPRGAAIVSAPDGTALLSGATRAALTIGAAADGRVSFALGGSPLTPAGGSLGGLSDAADHIADQRDALDSLAANVAGQLNTQHMAGRDAAGHSGAALFAIGTGAASLAAVALSAGEVAAADPNSPNGNAMSFGNLRASGGPESSWAALAAQQSQTVASARAQDGAATTRRDAAEGARDALSAVDIDREAADLIRFQQAYEASARVIQVARETIQSIMNVI